MTIRTIGRLTLSSGILIACAGTAAAQEGAQQSIPIGEADLYPAIRIDYRADDNVGLRSRDEINGSVVIVRPELLFVANRRLLEVRAGYQGAFSQGEQNSQDWNDHRLGVGVTAELDSRRRLTGDISLQRSHTELGTDLTRGRSDRFDEPVVFNRLSADGNFSYGAAEATGRITVGARFLLLDYTNLDEVTEGRDRRSAASYARFGYRIGGDTRAEIEVRYKDLAYDDDRFDRDELSLLSGVSFDSSGLLSGAARIGLQRVWRDADGLEDSTVLIVEAALEYQPVDYATLTFDVSRAVDNNARSLDATGSVESIETRATVGWKHGWSSRISTRTFAGVRLNEEACPVADTTTGEAGLEVGVALRRWLSVGVNAGLESRTADECAGNPDSTDLEYDRTTYGLFVRATL